MNSDANHVLLQEARMEASLQQLGKSRADLWQFAGLVALERSLERANRACDLDKWARQQVGRGVLLTPQQSDFWTRPRVSLILHTR